MQRVLLAIAFGLALGPGRANERREHLEGIYDVVSQRIIEPLVSSQ